MRKEAVPGRNNYDIACLHNISGDEELAIIISHGFGSSKESPTAVTLMETLDARGIGAFAYDFPGHGESPVGGEMLRIENCLDDLAAVEGMDPARARDVKEGLVRLRELNLLERYG